MPALLLLLCIGGCAALRLEPAGAAGAASQGEVEASSAKPRPRSAAHAAEAKAKAPPLQKWQRKRAAAANRTAAAAGGNEEPEAEVEEEEPEEEEEVEEEGCSFRRWSSTKHLKGVQLLDTESAPKPFVKFKHGSNNREGLFVYPQRNLAMCIIEKTGCTSWLTLFNKMTHKLNIHAPWYGIVQHFWNATDAAEVFSNANATRIVWVRDPLERFLSAFLQKCAVDHDDYKKICNFHWKTRRGNVREIQEAGFPLAQVREWFRVGHTMKELDSHFSPQSWHCELRERLHEYNVIGLMEKGRFAEDAACILERANLSFVNVRGPKDNRPFLANPANRGESVWQNTQILKKFFTKDFAHFLMDLYKEDYELFKIPRPKWVDEATGEWFAATPAYAADRARWLPKTAAEAAKIAQDEDAEWERRRQTGEEEETDILYFNDEGSDDAEEDLVYLAARAGFHLGPRKHRHVKLGRNHQRR